MAESNPVVEKVHQHLSTVLGPEELLLILRLQLHDGVSSTDVAKGFKNIKEAIRLQYPNFRQIFIEPVEEK
ncbi:MAG: hypothetical protein EOO53_22390 [Gammaproteobacteria bacterium]|nr:MAG: hypothetical protein EOO53_22390 [Gammaproteobacteria bacterium]